MAYSNTAYSHYGKYLETEVYSADPVKLVCMLYRGAIEATAAARRHLAARDVRQRSQEIMRADAILRELAHSLDTQYQISHSLGDLYSYMQTRLLEANSKQIDAPLAEVEQLLSTLLDGWKSIAAVAPPPVSTESYQPVSCTY
jgi:flagellar protein FliS